MLVMAPRMDRYGGAEGGGVQGNACYMFENLFAETVLNREGEGEGLSNGD